MQNNGWNNIKNIAFLLAGICAGALAMWGVGSLRDEHAPAVDGLEIVVYK